MICYMLIICQYRLNYVSNRFASSLYQILNQIYRSIEQKRKTKTSFQLSAFSFSQPAFSSIFVSMILNVLKCIILINHNHLLFIRMIETFQMNKVQSNKIMEWRQNMYRISTESKTATSFISSF